MLSVENLNKSFKDTLVLKDINCTFEEGKVYGLIGINGAGKSTLIRTIAGVYKSDEGKILYKGKDVYENTKAKFEIIFLSDSPFFFNNYSINNMAKYLSTYYDFDFELFKKLKESFKLDFDKRINNFSKGMKKQSELLLGLCCKPKLLLLDETFDGLDPYISIEVKKLILEMVETYKLTVLISSHNLVPLDSLCDKIYLLDNNILKVQKDEFETDNLFKIQLFFNNKTNDEVLKYLEDKITILDYKITGSILNLVVKGISDELKSTIKSLEPMVFDILEFSFEEKFIYDVGGGLDENK